MCSLLFYHLKKLGGILVIKLSSVLCYSLLFSDSCKAFELVFTICFGPLSVRPLTVRPLSLIKTHIIS